MAKSKDKVETQLVKIPIKKKDDDKVGNTPGRNIAVKYDYFLAAILAYGL